MVNIIYEDRANINKDVINNQEAKEKKKFKTF